MTSGRVALSSTPSSRTLLDLASSNQFCCGISFMFVLLPKLRYTLHVCSSAKTLVPKVNIHHRATANKLASNCVICRGPLGQGGCTVQGKKLKSHLAAPTVLLLTTITTVLIVFSMLMTKVRVTLSSMNAEPSPVTLDKVEGEDHMIEKMENVILGALKWWMFSTSGGYRLVLISSFASALLLDYFLNELDDHMGTYKLKEETYNLVATREISVQDKSHSNIANCSSFSNKSM
ncbi:hypothetical protein YC2023_067308 [Brassica napus]